MKLKTALLAVTLAAFVGAAIASCPNACSGHGSCGNHDRCKCYANWVGGDCSGKLCPYGRSDLECSGRGTCDRGAGTCECADGYSGASCQRISCPNNCNGQGSCDTSTGLCSCAGGYSGNDCSIRLCPKGDDPLTHEVENSGDGRASQQSEVQTVTFNAGRGLGGTATLTYHDLYGQSWTTRPFAVGGDQTYRLEIAVVPGTSITTNTQTLKFTYGSLTALFNFHDAGTTYTAAGTKDESVLRQSLLGLFAPYVAAPLVNKDRGSTISVIKHYSSTPAKLGGSIHQSARVIYDITIPVSMAGHDDNGGLTALTVAFNHADAVANSYLVSLNQMGDRSSDIANALTSLPNAVIPSVTVTKVAVTDSGTNDAGTNGNSYSQSYAITFNSESNAGDQNMLSCNAAPCDEDGCLNRGPGVSEVRYMRHDPENHGEGINFVSQGYFIMDIGKQSTDVDLSAGSIKIMWDTGSGISSAIFAVVATASEVQTALRTITGWEGVTVELWGSRKGNTDAANHILMNHQFKVTFAAGYDDMGKSPTFYTMTPSDGAYAAATDVRAKLYDQRFSNSIWMGKTTGYFEVIVNAAATTATAQFTKVGSSTVDLNIQPQSGNIYHFSADQFGAGAGTDNSNEDKAFAAVTGAAGTRTHAIAGDAATKIITTTTTIPVTNAADKLRFAYLVSSATSRQTSDYFAVGSTVEVLGTTWDDGSCNDASKTTQAACVGQYTPAGGSATDRVWIGMTTVTDYSNNVYRKFKVTGHVTNEFNTEFAKLDAFPSAEANSQPVVTGSGTTAIELEDLPDYNLKITNNNGTVRSYESTGGACNDATKTTQAACTAGTFDNSAAGGSTTDPRVFLGETIVTVNEVQVLVLATGVDGTQTTAASKWKLSYKGEMSQDMDHQSTPAQVAEEINGFSALSGPVTVAGEGSTANNGFPKYVITFDAADGDVAELGTHTDGEDVVTIVTRENGWSIEGPIGANLDTMQAGGTINITAAEVCTFTITTTLDGSGVSEDIGTGEVYYFCYDGICGSTPEANANSDAAAAIHSIKDDNGNQILTVTAARSGSNKIYTITMPLGKSCDGLEMRVKTAVKTAAITKSVNKHNNGKMFKITRSFLQVEEADIKTNMAASPAPEDTAETLGAGEGHSALAGVTTLVIGEPNPDSACDVKATTDYAFPVLRAVTPVHGGAAVAMTHLALKATPDYTNCVVSLRRYVITLDSMPTASDTSNAKTLLYKSPVGSCNVAETTKGTFESYECSNRGACDGKSGLCACYEGYSGESCQTQTVLV
eukprot:g4209.t1